MQKHYLEDVIRESKVSKTSGKPYTSLKLKISGRIYSGFGNPENAQWQTGDQVEVVLKQDGKYLNFEMPPKGSSRAGGASSSKIDEIEQRVAKLENSVAQLMVKSKYPAVDRLTRQLRDEESEINPPPLGDEDLVPF